MDVAVFIDGPIHDTAHQHEQDDQARMRLEDEAGWLVLRFHHGDADDGWLATIAANTDVFGPGTVRRMTVNQLPRRHPCPGPRPRLAGAARRPGTGCCSPGRWADATTKPRFCCRQFDAPTAGRRSTAPTVDDRGDADRARLLRDALRLSFRATGGPFRSLRQPVGRPRATTSWCR